MKPTKPQLTRAVKITLRILREPMTKHYYPNTTIRHRVMLYFGNDYRMAGPTLREILHDLRTHDEIRLLIAGTSGYKFATTVQQMESYMKRLHSRCVQQLQLLSACKRQTEINLGHQLGAGFYNEIYKQSK